MTTRANPFLMFTGRAGEALGCYERLLALNPRHADAWVQKAALLLDLRRLK